MTGTTEVDRISDQLERAFEGESWHGPPILEMLSPITAEQAKARPIESAHSIRELVNHVAAWLAIVRRRAGGEAIFEITTEMDWPTSRDSSASAWQETLAHLRDEYQQLRDFLDGLSDAELGNRVEGKLREYTTYQDLHGVVQHSLYHLGQVAVLLKAHQEDG